MKSKATLNSLKIKIFSKLLIIIKKAKLSKILQKINNNIKEFNKYKRVRMTKTITKIAKRINKAKVFLTLLLNLYKATLMKILAKKLIKIIKRACKIVNSNKYNFSKFNNFNAANKPLRMKVKSRIMINNLKIKFLISLPQKLINWIMKIFSKI